MKRALPVVFCFLLGSSAAWANHPEPGQMDRVEATAHDLEQAVHHVYDAAKKNGHPHHVVIDALHDLHDRAKDFHKQVGRHHQDPDHTESDFHRLQTAYRNALDVIADDHHARDDFRDVERHMRRLEAYYGTDDDDHHDRDDRHHH